MLVISAPLDEKNRSEYDYYQFMICTSTLCCCPILSAAPAAEEEIQLTKKVLFTQLQVLRLLFVVSDKLNIIFYRRRYFFYSSCFATPFAHLVSAPA